jgi:hypothetical protein
MKHRYSTFFSLCCSEGRLGLSDLRGPGAPEFDRIRIAQQPSDEIRMFQHPSHFLCSKSFPDLLVALDFPLQLRDNLETRVARSFMEGRHYNGSWQPDKLGLRPEE